MSYSFSAKGATKQEAAAAVAAQFDQVVVGQPVHAKDRDAVVNAAAGLIEVLADDDTQEVLVSINGYVTWNSSAEGDDKPIRAVSTTVSAVLQAKSAPTTEG